MKKSIWIGIFLSLCGSIFGQGKIIEGDTSSWYRWKKPLYQKLELKDFFQSEEEFNFRFQNHGQIVEISKNGDEFSGLLANYVFRETGRKKILKDTLYNYNILSPEKTKAIYDLLQELEMSTLPSEEDIEDWSWGFDGITYEFEYANRSNYAYKTYWSPHSMTSLKEAKLVLLFIKKLHEIIDLEQNRQDFKKTWSKSGCYNSGGLTGCFFSNSIGISYLGSSKFIYGFGVSGYINHIGKASPRLSLSIAYQWHSSNGKMLTATIGKRKVFFANKNNTDYLRYEFQMRNLDFLDSQINTKSHLLYYGTEILKIGDLYWRIGANVLEDEKNQSLGLFLRTGKWFSSKKIGFYGQCSIFSDQVNFQVGGTTYLRNILPRIVSINLYYEQFFDYKGICKK